MSAVAIATPGTMLDGFRRVAAIMPAPPPAQAISTSHTVGVVRARSSDWGCDSGVSRKYSVEVANPIPVNSPNEDLTARLATALGETVIEKVTDAVKDPVKKLPDLIKDGLNLLPGLVPGGLLPGGK